MKPLSILVTGACLFLGVANSYANLGDNYATSCQRYNGTGYIDRANATITWNVGGTLISEQFHNDKCVAMIYGSYGLSEAWLWQLLRINALTTQYWREYPDFHQGRSFGTTDDYLYGKYYIVNGWPMLRIAYKSWLNRHGMLSYSEPHAPVEERIPSAHRSSVVRRPLVGRHSVPSIPAPPPTQETHESQFQASSSS
jgi:hypothetical protein